MERAVCINVECGREFVSSPRLKALTGGLCRTCAADADRVERKCQECGGTFYEYPKFLQKIGAFAGARVRCPTCHDRKIGKDSTEVAEKRECLSYFPLVQIDLDLEEGEPCPSADGSGRNPVKMVLRDQRNKSWSGRLDVFDYRPDGQRGAGTLATVRVMEVTHAQGRSLEVQSGQVMGPKHTEVLQFDPTMRYLAIEPLEPAHVGKEPEARLVTERWVSKWNQCGGVEKNEALWSQVLTSCSRSGRHANGTLVAIVDEDHPVLVRQDHLVYRNSLSGRELEEAGFRDEVASGCGVSGFVAFGHSELCEKLQTEGWRVKLVTGGIVVKPRRNVEADCLEFPEGLDVEVRLEALEKGGGYTNTGWAVCVADLGGNPQRPYGTSGHRGPLACGTHAWFAVPEGLVTAQAGWWNKRTPSVGVSLHQHRWVETSPNRGRIDSEHLFSGAPNELPEKLEHLRVVMEAAARKAQTYHCGGVVFTA